MGRAGAGAGVERSRCGGVLKLREQLGYRGGSKFGAGEQLGHVGTRMWGLVCRWAGCSATSVALCMPIGISMSVAPPEEPIMRHAGSSRGSESGA